MRTIATLGVYQSSLDDFLDKLSGCKAALKRAGIPYRHFPELAPTTELRQLQYREDDRLKVGKRSRVQLAQGYQRRYLHEVLDQVDLGALLEYLPDEATSALLCVEQDARACHRSLIGARLQAQHGVSVLNL